MKKIFPSWQNALLAVIGSILLILAFPDFEFWFLAWFALVPLMWAIERERSSTIKSFGLGWIFGTVFFFGTCWWLTFAPITYAGFPWPLAYFLMLCVCLAVGLFPAIFAAILSVLLRRFGSWALLAAPFVWVSTEFLRYWLTGNNWNAIGYSQAFSPMNADVAAIGGVLSVSFGCTLINSVWMSSAYAARKSGQARFGRIVSTIFPGIFLLTLLLPFSIEWFPYFRMEGPRVVGFVVAIQPNVPMSAVDSNKLDQLRQRQIERAEAEVNLLRRPRWVGNQNPVPVDGAQPPRQYPTLVILPESPMNFMYNDDREFQAFIHDFARRNNVSVLFNSAEPDATNGKYFNSAVMVSPEGREAVQYDKIYLLPFGEAVPAFLEGIVPGFVGNFSYGGEYDLFPLGDAKAGVMICFESHFGQLSREYVRNGADVIIEMTNDGYLGPTPVLRQHLANAVFRAVETNRPVLRVTNVGVTAYISERGQILDPAPTYAEATRVWTVSKSDGSQTFYVKYGDWFAWLCSVVTIALLLSALYRRTYRNS